jgi:uncharacterized protein YggU (UPF0235/DUF167 family)
MANHRVQCPQQPVNLAFVVNIMISKVIKLVVQVSPKSKNPRVIKTVLGFKFFLTSSPVCGRANAELVHTIAQILSVPRSKISVATGHASKIKFLQIITLLSIEEIQQKIEKVIEV